MFCHLCDHGYRNIKVFPFITIQYIPTANICKLGLSIEQNLCLYVNIILMQVQEKEKKSRENV